MSPRPGVLPAPAVALRLAVGMTLWFVATAGGRITASDEYTMYRLTEAIVTQGTVSVDAGNAERGPDGKLYPKAAIGQAIAAAPFYAAGRAAALAFPEPKRELVTRAVTSLLGPVAGGLLAAFLFLLFLEVGASPRGALFWSLAACLATPLWVYAKSFLTEPLSALGLVAGLYGALRFQRGGGPQHALLCGLAWGGTVLVKYALLPAVVVLAIPFLPQLRRGRDALPGVFAVLVCAALALAYNAMRTGSVLGSGYGRQGTLEAFTTPLYVGLDGLLLSSGKGVIWFAPLVVLVPAAFVPAWRRLGAPAAAIAVACALMTLVYASFEHWAGDGSWGPRYLVPLVPLALVLVVAAHAQQPWGGAPRRALVGTLAALGLLVQIGGVGIYFGAQMREAGDYPYTKALDDPSFMVESHFNPARSPIAHHWRMLARNVREHAAGRWPRLTPASGASVESERLAVPADQVQGLTHALDFWWAYAAYAGLPRMPLLALALAVTAAAVLQLVYAAKSARDLELRPLPQAPDVWAA
jgi:hypothetical protein